MKYFTPELYLRFNSKNPEEVRKAHDEWEEAIAQYHQCLDEIGPKLTLSARQLARSLCLHDAEFVGLTWMPLAFGPFLPTNVGSSAVAVLTVRHDANVSLLVYLLAQEPSIHDVEQRWPFSKEKVHWLYDEFSVNADGQQHAVLLSNGRIVTIKFHELQLIKHDFSGRLAVA